MGLYDLVGQEITITTMGGRDGKTGVVIDKVRWLVVQAFPHHVLCVREGKNGDDIRECFSVGTLVEQGIVTSDKTMNRVKLKGGE